MLNGKKKIKTAPAKWERIEQFNGRKRETATFLTYQKRADTVVLFKSDIKN
jgi:hypothetical protein